jgi:stage II sporulation protein Q
MREEEKKQTSLKRFFKKRWVFPAVYIASAALILTAVLWFQNSSTDKAIDSNEFNFEASPGENGFDEPAKEVTRPMENLVLPLSEKDRTNAVIQTKFYDDNANEQDQEAALVVYKNQYHPNTGIDIKVNDNEAFDVLAALSGTVTKVEEDALLGNVIEVKHEDNIITRYSSIKDMKVAIGDEIEQGQAIATAGQSQFNEEAGVHVHFEIRKDGMPVNPENYVNKPFSELQESATIEETVDSESGDSATETEESGVSEEESTEEPAEGEKPADEEKSSDRQEDQENNGEANDNQGA